MQVRVLRLVPRIYAPISIFEFYTDWRIFSLRLMVGRLTLNQWVEVRILEGKPD